METKAFGERRFALERLEARELLAGHPWSPAAVLIGQDRAVANYPQLTGAGQTVVIIDSGVDYAHPVLGGGIGPGYKVVAGWDFVQDDANPMPDTFAHGTGAAGVVAADSYAYGGYHAQGIAPGVNLIALRQQDSYGVKAALEWTLANVKKYNIVAVNLTDYRGPWGTIYQDAMRQLVAAGVFVSHPSGNGGAGAGMAAQLDPADFSVGSVNWSGQISSFTQRGPDLDLLAPGENVTLPYFNIVTREHVYTGTADGTSWASPVAVGAAALIKQIDPRFTPMQIMSILQDSGAPVYDPASKRTYKRIDLNAALGLAYQRRPATPAPVPQPPLSGPPIPVPPVVNVPNPPPTQPGQSPFSGKRIRVALATTIQAEDFDNGGEGVAYHDAERANIGRNNYRPGAGVDVERWGSGVRDVGEIRKGEWMEYSVDVATAGTFDFTARLAAQGAGGRFHVEVDGVNQTGSIAVPNTGGWNKWATAGNAKLSLSAGAHVIRFSADAANALGYTTNLDWFKLTPASAHAVKTTVTSAATLTATNYSAQSGVHRSTNSIGYLDQGDWVAYKGIDFGAAGLGAFTAGVAAPNGKGGKKIQVRVGSPTGQVLGTLTVTATGGWGTFKAESTPIARVTGVQDVYLTFAGGSGVGNVQWLKFA